MLTTKRQHWGAMPWLFGESAIPEWSDEEICAIERLDVHGSRCRCRYCKARSHEIESRRAYKAERKAEEQAWAEQEARAEEYARIRAHDEAVWARAKLAAIFARDEPEYARLLTDDELQRFHEVRRAEIDRAAELRSAGALRSA